MTVQWVLSGVALVIAAGALVRARRAVKRLERLSEAYWELRYDVGQLRSRLARLDPEEAVPGLETPPPAAPRAGSTAFVPLSSLKR